MDEHRTESYRVATISNGSDYYPQLKRKPKRTLSNTPKKNEFVLSNLRKDIEIDEHRIPLDQLYARYGTDPLKGLPQHKAKESLRQDGFNELSPPDDPPEWVKFCRHLFSGTSFMLWLAASLCFSAFSTQIMLYEEPPGDNLYIGIFIIALIIVLSCFAYYREDKLSKLMETFRTLIPQYAVVIRDGEKLTIRPQEIVCGDIIEVRAGDRIPADFRIISALNFKVNNFNLTGSSEPQQRNSEYTSDNPLETKNLSFFATTAVEGTARGIVINSGDRTVLGRMANLASGANFTESNISRQLFILSNISIMMGLSLGIFFFLISFAFGFYSLYALTAFAGIVLGSVPEAVMAIITIMLIWSAQRLIQKNCLVRNLDSIEALSAATVILTDKKAILTADNLAVAHMWFDKQIVEAETREDQSGTKFNKNSSACQHLLRVAALCNDALFMPAQDGIPIMQRDTTAANPIEAALLKCAELSLGDVTSLRDHNSKLCQIKYNQQNKFQVSIHQTDDPSDPSYYLTMWGEPQQILDRCSSIYLNGRELVLDKGMREAFNNAHMNLVGLGEQVLGLCDYKLPRERYPPGFPFDAEAQNFPMAGLRFLGLMSLMESARPGVQEAVNKCRRASIKVILVTGDHPVTAKAIATNVGIIASGHDTVEDIAYRHGRPLDEIDQREAQARIVNGAELRDMSSLQLNSILTEFSDVVFAYTTPPQKLTIVEALQEVGHVVVVTGDGVYDTASFKKADIGVGMGISGTAVNHEAADLICLDDNFKSIISAIEEGRLLYENMKKALAFSLTTNIAQMTPFMMYVFMGIPLPLGLIPLLFIELIFDVIQALSLFFERPEYEFMDVPSRNKSWETLFTCRLINRSYGQVGMIHMLAGFFSYFIVMADNGFWPRFLIKNRLKWDSKSINDLEDFYGQEWTYDQRKRLEYTCHTAFVVAIMLCQWLNLLMCKVRWNALPDQIRQPGGRRALIFNLAAMFFTLILAILLSYLPYMVESLRFAPLRVNWWFAFLPFGLLIVLFEEIRRYLVRRETPLSPWFVKENY